MYYNKRFHGNILTKLLIQNIKSFHWEEWVEPAIEPRQWSWPAPGTGGFLSAKHLGSHAFL